MSRRIVEGGAIRNLIRKSSEFERWPDVITTLVEVYPIATTRVDQNGNLPLHSAAAFYSGAGDTVDKDEDYGIDVVNAIAGANPAALGAINTQGDTVLHCACRFQRNTIGVVNDVIAWHSLRRIIEMCGSGALNSRNHNGQTPFHLLVSTCAQLAPVEHILQVKRDAPTIRDNSGNLPLHCMGEDTLFTTAERLLSAFPRALSVCNNAGDLPLTAVALNGASMDVVYTLVRGVPDHGVPGAFITFRGNVPTGKRPATTEPEENPSPKKTAYGY